MAKQIFSKKKLGNFKQKLSSSPPARNFLDDAAMRVVVVRLIPHLFVGLIIIIINIISHVHSFAL